MGQRERKRLSIIALLLIAGLFIAVQAHANTLVCALDVNNNGTIDQGETATCTGDAGTLCPLDAVACTLAQSPPTCPTGGSYVPADDRCEAPVPPFVCSLNGQTFDSLSACDGACVQTAACRRIWVVEMCPLAWGNTCVNGQCSVSYACNQASCASGYIMTGGICAAPVTCAQGTYSSTAKACVDDTSWVCPHGSSYPCLDNAGTYECSTATCINPSTAQTTTVSTAMLQDNGARDASGNCLGTIYIFSGRKMTCNKAGYESGWKKRCQTDSPAVADDLGSAQTLYSAVGTISTVYHLGQIAYYGSQMAAAVYAGESAADATAAVGAMTSSLSAEVSARR